MKLQIHCCLDEMIDASFLLERSQEGEVLTDALFVSGLQRSDEPTAGQVRQAVAGALRAFGCLGCAARVAQEFGDHPETAASRMRWARAAAHAVFAYSSPEPGPAADAGGLLVVHPGPPAGYAAGSPAADWQTRRTA